MIQGDGNGQFLQRLIEDPDKAAEVIKMLDERLTKLKEAAGSCVDLEMPTHPYVDLDVTFE